MSASDFIELKDENKALKKKVIDLETRVAFLEKEKEDLDQEIRDLHRDKYYTVHERVYDEP